jgi:hypothetical protein
MDGRMDDHRRAVLVGKELLLMFGLVSWWLVACSFFGAFFLCGMR